MINYTLEIEAKTLERMGEMISHLSEDYTKISAKYLQLLEKNKQLEKRLEIATKALKEYDNKLNWDIRGVSFMKYNKGFTIARKALKEMEGVK